jgi:translation initiation factor 2 alpha subunit (eIF-2alpha)
MEYHEGDLVLGTVEQISNNVCFVKLPCGAKGTIISSEIAAGRIKLMRTYVVPNKKIVCKVLRVEKDHIELSLRRVGSKDKAEVMKKYKQEQARNSGFKQILGEDYEKVNGAILDDYCDLSEFMDKAKEDKELIGKYVPKDKQEQIEKLANKKKKKVEVRYTLNLRCLEGDGVHKIKELLGRFDEDEVKINYLSAGIFDMRVMADDFKEAKQKMTGIIEKLEKNSKELKCEFASKEEKG